MWSGPLSVGWIAAGLGLNPVQAFVTPPLPEGLCIPRRAQLSPAAKRSSDGGGSRGRLHGIIRPRPGPAAVPTFELAAAGAGEAAEEEEEEEEATDEGSSGGERKKDAGVLAATGATGAFLGWNLAHSLGLGLDLVGALGGCLAAVGLLAQEGTVGEATTKFGQFALGAFEVAGTVAASTDAPAKAANAVGEEILEVVEFATAAATKGYYESVPEPNLKLQKEVAKSKKTIVDLRGQVDEVKQALSEAKAQLAERAANQKIVDAAKSTAAELEAAKKVIKEKNAAIAENLKLARKVKDNFDSDLQAARAETARFREMIESRADMDDNFKLLAEASHTLEERVQEYEARLRVLTEENDGIRADYTAEIKRMEAERTSMRERIAGLESALESSETAIDRQRADLEAELFKMGEALDEKAAAAEAATALAAEMKAAVQKSLQEKGEAVERAAAEAKAAGAAKTEAAQEKARAAQEVKAAKMEAAKAADAARAEAAAKAKSEKLAAKAAAEKAKEAKKREADEEAKAKSAQATAAAAKKQKKAAEEGKRTAAAAKAAAGETAKRQRLQKEHGATAQKEKGRAKAQPRSRAKAAKAPAPVVGAGADGGAGAGPREAGAVTKEGLMKSTVKDLRERCKAAGVPTSGKKSELVDRLVEASLSVA